MTQICQKDFASTIFGSLSAKFPSFYMFQLPLLRRGYPTTYVISFLKFYFDRGIYGVYRVFSCIFYRID